MEDDNIKEVYTQYVEKRLEISYEEFKESSEELKTMLEEHKKTLENE